MDTILSQTIEEIARRAEALGLVYSRTDITYIEDNEYTLVMLKDYIEPYMAARRSALETYYIHPGVFSNPGNCDDIELRSVLERGYIEGEIIPYLNCVVRVVIRRKELFAIISPDDEVMFADSIRDDDSNIFRKYFKGKLT
jgi:hypothetical protein